MIEIAQYVDLPGNIKARLNQFINIEFGHIPIVQETEWAVPDWTIIKYLDNQIVSFYNIVIREIVVDKSSIRIGGINNVITPIEHRGRGYASELLSQTGQIIFNKLDCEFGVLLCADKLIPFYEKLNWYLINCPVYFNQSTGKKLWTANTMLSAKGEKFHPHEIDLNGLPW